MSRVAADRCHVTEGPPSVLRAIEAMVAAACKLGTTVDVACLSNRIVLSFPTMHLTKEEVEKLIAEEYARYQGRSGQAG
jgi:hypothetical protein